MRPTLLETVPEQVSLPADHIAQSSQPGVVTVSPAVSITEKAVQVANVEKTPQQTVVLKPRTAASRVSYSNIIVSFYHLWSFNCFL
jgi:hypothetical protein